MVLDQVLVQAHVLLLGQNGVVGLEVVLGQQFLIAESTVVSTREGLVQGKWETDATPWMSRSGFSRQRSSKLPLEAMVQMRGGVLGVEERRAGQTEMKWGGR